jgi:hypothetical protein
LYQWWRGEIPNKQIPNSKRGEIPNKEIPNSKRGEIPNKEIPNSKRGEIPNKQTFLSADRFQIPGRKFQKDFRIIKRLVKNTNLGF